MIARPTPAERHKRELLRYFVLASGYFMILEMPKAAPDTKG